MSYHLDHEAIEAYRGDQLDPAATASLETHLTACSHCQGMVALDQEWIERSWASISGEVLPGRPGPVERTLTAIGVPQHTARLVAVTPALRISFVVAVALVLGFAALASDTAATSDMYRIFLVVAPLIPVAGVALAYGRLADPAFEFTMSSPINTFQLLMLRTTAVLIVSVGLGLAVWPFMSYPGWLGVSGWLLPSLALTLVTLALASRLEMWLAGAMTAAGWALAMTLAWSWDPQVVHGRADLVYLVLIATAATTVLLRRDSYDRSGGPS